MTDWDMAWLCGILEGEGSFYVQRHAHGLYPRVAVRMTDEDVVARVASLFEVTYQRQHSPSAVALGRKPVFIASIICGRASRLMLQVYPHMGQRRREKIREVLQRTDRQTFLYMQRSFA